MSNSPKRPPSDNIDETKNVNTTELDSELQMVLLHFKLQLLNNNHTEIVETLSEILAD